MKSRFFGLIYVAILLAVSPFAKADLAGLHSCLSDSRVKALLTACTSTYTKTSTDCDERNQTLGAIALDATTAKNKGGIQSSCQASAAIDTKTADAFNKFATTCTGSQSSCHTACGLAKTEVVKCQTENTPGYGSLLPPDPSDYQIYEDNVLAEETRVSPRSDAVSNALSCDTTFKDKITQAKTAATGAQSSGAAGKSCADNTSDSSGEEKKKTEAASLDFPIPTPSPAATPATITATGPQGCADPNSTDKVCICQHTPSLCNATDGAAAPEGIGANDSSVDAPSATALPGPSMNNPLDIAAKSNTPSADVGGKMGGAAQLGGSADFKSSGAALGKAAADDGPLNNKVTAGFYGGQGSGGAGGRQVPAYREVGNGDKRTPASTDLRAYLPDGTKYKEPQRMAGKDGITGPEGYIWGKIQKRYIDEGSSFLP